MPAIATRWRRWRKANGYEMPPLPLEVVHPHPAARGDVPPVRSRAATEARMIDVIYCGGGNRRLAEIAVNAGFLYGARLPDTTYFPLHFADQEYKTPNRAAYMAALDRQRPCLATVLDWEQPEQLPEVLSWAEDAARYVDEIVLIPKVSGGVPSLPRSIAGKGIRLGYSVPTSYGGTTLHLWEFLGWPIHLLGGSPHAQMRLVQYLNVVSADWNYAQNMALNFCQFWQAGTATYASNRYWPTIVEADGKKWGDGTTGAGAPYEAFRRSCETIMQAWKGERVTRWGSDRQRQKTSRRSNAPHPSSQMSLDL